MRGIVIKRIESEIVIIPLGIFVFKFIGENKERSLSLRFSDKNRKQRNVKSTCFSLSKE